MGKKKQPKKTSSGNGAILGFEAFVEEHGGRIGDIVVYGQESNPTTRRLALTNPAIRGIKGDVDPDHASKLEAAIETNLKGVDCG